MTTRFGNGVDVPSLGGAVIIGNFVTVNNADYTIGDRLGSGSSAVAYAVNPNKGGKGLAVKVWRDKYKNKLPDADHRATWDLVAGTRFTEFVVRSELYKNRRRGFMLLMERGASLSSRPKIDLDSLWRWLRKMLVAALENMIAPTDVSPSNLLVFPGGEFRLTDVEDYRILGVDSEVLCHGTYACDVNDKTDDGAVLNAVYATLATLHHSEFPAFNYEHYYYKSSVGRHWNRLASAMKATRSRAKAWLDPLAMKVVTSGPSFRKDVIELLKKDLSC